MSVIEGNTNVISAPTVASEVLDHYRRSGLIYDDKEKRLSHFLDRFRHDLTDAIDGPDAMFQIHSARSKSGHIRASVSAYRDALDTFMIQHAASERAPRMLRTCLYELFDGLDQLGCTRLAMFYTESNGWPARLVEALTAATSDQFDIGFDYYHRAGPVPSVAVPHATGLHDVDIGSVLRFCQQNGASHIASTLQNNKPDEISPGVFALRTPWQSGTERTLVLPQTRNGRIVGVAVIIRSPLVLSLSHLCNRVELYPAQDDPSSLTTISDLLNATARTVGVDCQALWTVLVPSLSDSESVEMPFYGLPVRQYRKFSWTDEAGTGLALTRSAVAGLYDRRLAGATATGYLMEGPEEVARLERKTKQNETRRQLALVGLSPGSHCLDVGTGSGAVSRVMAEMVGPAGSVIGVDVSKRRLAAARKLAADVPNLDFVKHDVHLPWPEDQRFDFVWSRFLFEYLEDPGTVIANLTEVLAPGGKLVVGDLDGNCQWHHPLPPDLNAGLDLIRSELAGVWDPYVGRKLFGLFQRQSLLAVRVHVLPYNVAAGGLSEDQRANWEAKLSTIAMRAAPVFGGPSGYATFVRRLMSALDGPDSFSYSSLILVEGTHPPAGEEPATSLPTG